MARKEQVTNKVKEIVHESGYNAIPSTLFEMAAWADKTMIEKACKYLINIDFDDFHFRDCDETFNNDLFVDAFRKAMEE